MKHRRKNRIKPAKSLRLRQDHNWKAPAGFKIVVLDRGAVSFNVPESWVIVKMEPALELNDGEPPDDNARLSVSFWRTPPGIDWSGLPVDELLAKSTDGDSVEILERREVSRIERDDMELVWTEHRFMDPDEKREAFSRVTLARGWDMHVLMSFDYWADEAEKFLPVWAEAVRSLQLGRQIDDPTRGAVLH
ncbi:MAG TPA: hypothetical protein VKY59_09650 [Spirillospora sp.]|nr:hypothetical protein [Spirillospora sp.]